MNNITIAEDNRNIKKALQQEFPRYKISIRNGRGTAYGWKEIRIDTDIPEKLDENGFLRYNEEEKKQFEEIRRMANAIIKVVGKRIGKYYADDGYNTEDDEVLLTIEGKRNE